MCPCPQRVTRPTPSTSASISATSSAMSGQTDRAQSIKAPDGADSRPAQARLERPPARVVGDAGAGIDHRFLDRPTARPVAPGPIRRDSSRIPGCEWRRQGLCFVESAVAGSRTSGSRAWAVARGSGLPTRAKAKRCPRASGFRCGLVHEFGSNVGPRRPISCGSGNRESLFTASGTGHHGLRDQAPGVVVGDPLSVPTVKPAELGERCGRLGAGSTGKRVEGSPLGRVHRSCLPLGEQAP